jgi:hypothetical protein
LSLAANEREFASREPKIRIRAPGFRTQRANALSIMPANAGSKKNAQQTLRSAKPGEMPDDTIVGFI